MHNFLKSISICLFCVFLLTGCIPAFGGISSKEASSEITIINEMFPKIIEAINNKDVNALREFFAEAVLSEYEEFEEDAKVLFDFIDGEVITYPSKVYPATHTSYNAGETVSFSEAFPYVETDSGVKYQCYFKVCVEDSKNLENKGIHMIEFIVAGSEDNEDKFASLGIDESED